jgi:Pentapeptide repeats (8 copies)
VHRARGVAVILIVVLAAACSNEVASKDEAGTCPVQPGADCRNQDLRNVSFVDAEISGIDLSGADLSGADMRGADLTGAKLVDARLAGTDFTGATLKDADLTRAFLFTTNLTDADLTGAIQTGTQRCNVVEPDGAFTEGAIIGADGVPVPCGGGTTVTTALGAKSVGPPTIKYFRLTKPAKCLNDTSGTGIEVEWYAPNASTLTFLVDGVRIETATTARGTQRLPFECDRKKHIVSVQAFGATRPDASSAFTVALRPVAPLTADG